MTSRTSADDLKLEMGKVQAHVDEWTKLKDILLKWPTFGLFAIFMTHPLSSRRDYVVKVMPLLLLVAQLLIPTFLFASAFANYDQGLCPPWYWIDPD